MNQEKLYIEKELSWLSFNERVLQEAADKSNPLIERIRFLGIYSSNLDEFYKVRFADVKRRILIKEEQGSASSSRQVLKKIQAKVLKTDLEFDNLYNELLLEMARNQVFLINERQLSENQQIWLRHYFKNHLRQHITPILLNNDISLLEFLKDDYTYLAVEIVINADKKEYALLEIPSNKVSRFITLPPEPPRRRKPMILLDNIIRFCLDDIFKGFFDYQSLDAYSMKMTRDAEYDLVNEMESSWLELMSSSLKQRLTAEPVRFVYQRDMPNDMVEILRKKLGISSYDSVIPGGRYHNFKDFISFPNVGKANLVNKPLPRLRHIWFNNFRNGFDAIKERDVLLYYPYHTFEHVLELVRQASFDPNVLAIKINIYRVAKDSRIIESMINAAHNGKKVTVVVELQARFDEEANIHWAKRLTEAGVHVIFSAPGLKIHAKLFLISRIEDGQIVRYAHIGTGNFNEKTARLYTDFSLLTADSRITNEVRRVFNFIENPYRPVSFEHLLVSPQNSRLMLNKLIDREISFAQAGLDAGITLKINNLVDKELIDRLYAASGAGVKIRLIVRGMCSLVPNLPGISENIQVTSIVDRFLEHARVYIFENQGDNQVFISSADWMTRNIDYRIEVGVAILDPVLKQRVLDIIDIQLSDTVKARIIDKELSNQYVPRGNRRKVRSQIAIYDYLKALEQPTNVESTDIAEK
ncbi:polyphosphate kinase 1 [Limnobaculum xujianqingii]|uniref:polyphosphate kinase 1 n=1 Tax=Limnobaculum xujianqingii TaxID=2738837 RepID=UPI001129A81F|nr:polyphosphate kinase 1 [Limnobaculum xujianqingii]